MLVGCACLALIIPAESLTLVPVAAGDILLDFSLDQPVYLQGEPIIGILNIYNDMDDPIVIWPDSEDASTRLECRIEWQGDERVPARKQAPLVDRLGVNPDQTESVMLMLSEHYNLYEIGRYRAVMELHWQGKIHTSRMQIIDVVRGLEIDSIQRGVRGYPDKPRQYSLRYLTRNQREQLFLVVDDDRYHFGSFLLGPVIRFQKPGMTLNRDGRLVVYHQSSPIRPRFVLLIRFMLMAMEPRSISKGGHRSGGARIRWLWTTKRLPFLSPPSVQEACLDVGLTVNSPGGVQKRC